MKGLFIKDLRILKGQKQFFAAILIMMVIFTMSYTNISFVICYITIMMGVLTLTTISYDEYENGMGYLFTLPVSRREYVGEKYLFSIMSTVCGLAVVSITVLAATMARNIDFSLEEWVSSVVGSFLVVTVALSLLLPTQLKFGADKSRVATMIVYGGMCAGAYIAVKVCDFLGIDWKMALERIAELGPAILLSGMAVICGIIMLISYLVSVSFIGKREF